MQVEYRNQPPCSNQCGQAVVAMILNKSVEEVCKEMNKKGRTNNKSLKLLLKKYGIELGWSRCKKFEDIPEFSIVKMNLIPYDQRHYTLKLVDSYYDPDLGEIKNYNIKLFRPVSYMKIYGDLFRYILSESEIQ